MQHDTRGIFSNLFKENFYFIQLFLDSSPKQLIIFQWKQIYLNYEHEQMYKYTS